MLEGSDYSEKNLNAETHSKFIINFLHHNLILCTFLRIYRRRAAASIWRVYRKLHQLHDWKQMASRKYYEF